MNVSIHVDGQERWSAALALTVENAVNFERSGPEIEDAFHEDEKAWLDSEGEGTFEPLTEKYAEWKAKHFPGKTILRREDNLYRALTEHGAADTIYEVSPHEATFGVGGETGRVGRYHQDGTARMKARPPVRLSDEGVRRIEAIIKTDADTFAREQGL